MHEIFQYLILFLVGITAGFINVNAGGGSSLILPCLIFMGLEGSVANGTNRIAQLTQCVFAISSFRQKKMSNFRLSIKLSLITIPGAILGAITASKINDELFQRILGFVLIGVVATMFVKKSKSNSNDGFLKKNSWVIYPVLFGIGFYGGFIQVGVGFLFMAALYHIMRMNLVTVNMHKVFIIGIYTVPALIVFMLTGNVNWKLGFILSCGMAAGGWIGAHAVVKGGEKLIRYVLTSAICIIAIKLLGII